MAVALNFVQRRCQPCKERAHPAFDYRGAADPTRENSAPLAQREIERQLREMFALDSRCRLGPGVVPYSAEMAPPLVT